MHDHFLNVAVCEVRICDCNEGVDAFGSGLSDTAKNSGGVGHLGAPRGVQGCEPTVGGLVGSAVMRTANFVQTVGEGLDHHPLAG